MKIYTVLTIDYDQGVYYLNNFSNYHDAMLAALDEMRIRIELNRKDYIDEFNKISDFDASEKFYNSIEEDRLIDILEK